MTKALSPQAWLSTAEFAAAAGVGKRSAIRILQRALDGQCWRGAALDVREVRSRGGAHGVALQVRASSLPKSESCALLRRPAPRRPARPPHSVPHRVAVAAERSAIIEAALCHPPGTAERREAVIEAARWSGKSEATIYAWLAAEDRQGVGGLFPAERADRRQRQVYISRAWDAAVPFDDATKATIRDKLDPYINELWTLSTEYGWSWVSHLAAFQLQELTAEAGFEIDLELCRLGQLRVSRERHKHRAAALFKYDRKRWEDENRPRVERSRAACRPMEIVMADVHPLDILLPRADGSTFTARLVAFEDYATARAFLHVVLPAKGRSVRQECIAAGIVAMSQAPGWGLPQTLYIDNGGEYNCVGMIRDCMELAWRARVMGGEASGAVAPAPVVKALPYNAAAKSIESLFARLERGVFSLMDGHIGGDRTAKKTANVGRPPAPYPRGEAAFRQELASALTVYETKPQSGQLAGRSPRQAYEAAVAEGWRPVGIELDAILAGFARDASAVVRQGAFRHGGRTWTAPEIEALAKGTPLHLRVPVFSGAEAIAVMRDDELLCVALPKTARHPLDAAGAREAAQGHGAAKAAARVAGGGGVDRTALLDRLAAKAGPGSDPDPVAMVRLDDGREALGRAMRAAKQTPADRLAEADEIERLRRERRMAAFRRFDPRTGTDG